MICDNLGNTVQEAISAARLARVLTIVRSFFNIVNTALISQSLPLGFHFLSTDDQY